ncbi:hypothetical protein IFT90_04300 [Frigoribacterium sp. CFBP 8766]|uniref:hypothetical protein n=1 Tax=Frigoribacterium sp. CFBP 8766 TaxID=2775273 RepID=UPI00177D7E67|nr:hypothetical protein [Frigoribacterium sp. CFBP 8766]MBD8583777.1 hypothetical protein [Frigoribacterium sp. CFBP 8766]
MALTHHLKDRHSPVRQFLEKSAPRLALAGSPGPLGREVADEFSFYRLTSRALTVPIPAGVEDKRTHASPVGMALDYRVRMMLGGSWVDGTTAQIGLQRFQNNTKGIRYGRRMAQVLADALELAVQQAEAGTDEDQDRLAVVLAWCESFYRAGIHALIRGSIGKQLRNADSPAVLLESIDPLIILDLAALRRSSTSQIGQWSSAVQGGSRLELNPDFDGSGAVGGADADWLIEDTLIDCKATEQLGNAWIRKTLFQLVGYTLLDFDDSLKIRQIAIWLPRRQALQVWSLAELLRAPVEQALPELRASFEAMLRAWHEQMHEESVARREAIAQWREEMEARWAAEEAAEALMVEERRARRREADRKRRKAKKAAALLAAVNAPSVPQL